MDKALNPNLKKKLEEIADSQKAAVFDVLCLMNSNESKDEIVSFIMEQLEKSNPNAFKKWLNQESGPSMTQYFQ